MTEPELVGDWAIEGACANSDSTLFFPEDGDYGPALEVCKACDVRSECLAHALTQNEAEGVWGGTTPSQRKTLRRRLQKDRRAARLRQPNSSLSPRWAKSTGTHGTRGAYVNGCRCEDCTEAARLYERGRRREKV
jgi:WhiB family redox-sensing transcriptional regulator